MTRLRAAKKTQKKRERKPDNKTSITNDAVNRWLKNYEGSKKSIDEGGVVGSKGKKDLTISMPIELYERLEKELERRINEQLEPTSKRAAVELALIEWLDSFEEENEK